LRRLSVDERATIASPAEGEKVPRGPLVILAQVYDTVDRVAGATASIQDSTGSLVANIPLTRSGIAGWKGFANVSGWSDGPYTIQISGSFEGGAGFFETSSFSIVSAAVPGVQPLGNWSMLRGTKDGRSFRDEPLALPLRLAWVEEVPGMVAHNSPIVHDGRVFMGCRTESDINDPGIVAFDAVTGARLWRRNINGGVAFAPFAVDGILVVNALNDSVYGLDCATGAEVWSLEAPGSMYMNAAPIGDASGVLVSSKPYCYMVDPMTGGVIWKSDYIGQTWYEFTFSAVAMTADKVFLNTFGGLGLTGGLDIFNRADGTRVTPQIPGVFRAPAVVGDTLVIGGGANLDQHYLTFRDHAGNILGSGVESLGRGMGGVAIGHGIAVIAGRRGEIVAYSLDSGDRLWAHEVGDVLLDMSQGVIGGKMTQACPVIADRTVFIGSIDGVLYALDLETGTELWSMSFGMPIASTAALAGNMLYVGCSDGNLYALKGNSDFMVSSIGEGIEGETGIWFRREADRSGSSTASFEWNLPAASEVELSVFDIRGRRIATLARGPFAAGHHRAVWDGRLPGSGSAASGMYFARLMAGRTVLTEKVVIVK
jgi:outer membrane protein assembly factor BamB